MADVRPYIQIRSHEGGLRVKEAREKLEGVFFSKREGLRLLFVVFSLTGCFVRLRHIKIRVCSVAIGLAWWPLGWLVTLLAGVC